MANILRKNSSIDDKVNRLSAIEYEENNAELCDYVVSFDTYDDAVRQLSEILSADDAHPSVAENQK
jgi:guanylate kinase